MIFVSNIAISALTLSLWASSPTFLAPSFSDFIQLDMVPEKRGGGLQHWQGARDDQASK